MNNNHSDHEWVSLDMNLQKFSISWFLNYFFKILSIGLIFIYTETLKINESPFMF